MGLLELATAISVIVGAITYCCVKIIGQIESNKFTMCKCWGTECVRDVDEPTQIVDVNTISPPQLSGKPPEVYEEHFPDQSKNNIINIDEEMKAERIFLPTNGGISSPRLPKYPRPTLKTIVE